MSFKINLKDAISRSLKKYNDTYMKEAHNRIDNIVAQAGTDNTEIVDARMDSSGKKHSTLNNRIVNEFKMSKEHLQEVKGEYVIVEGSVPSTIQDIELYGNTVQGTNLVDIKSCGIDNGDGTFKMSILSCGENLFNKFNQDSVSSSNYFDSSYNGYVSSKRNSLEGFYTVIRVEGRGMYLNFEKEGSAEVGFRFSDSIPTDFESAFTGISIVGAGYRENTSKCKYMIVTFRTLTEGTLSKIKNIKICEGTVATPYTPYEETRCDIKLPCQLEKWDRLYYDKEENALSIDKNMTDSIFNGSENWVVWNITETNPNPNLAYFILDNGRVNPSLISVEGYCNQFKISPLPNVTEECLAYRKIGDIDRIYLAINKSKASTVSELKSYLKSNNLLVKYLSKDSIKIVLPQSEQIKLNSFANKTHIYTISGEVDATVKATVSKSMASTVMANTNEINNLSSKIADIEGLKETQDFSYETDKGYLVCKDTQNGVVKDLKLYGKSLVNDGGKVNGQFSQFSTILNSLKMLKPSTEYTLVINNKTNTDLIVYTAEETIVPTQNIYLKSNSSIVKKVVSQASINSLRLLKTNTVGTNLFDLEVLFLEGDYTQNPPDYFEGIESVGNGNEIEVLTRKEDGNLFDGELLDGLYNTSTGVFTPNSDVKCNKNKIAIFANRKIKLSQPLTGGSYRVFYYNSKGDYLESQLITSPYTFTPNVNARYINFQIAKTHYKEGIALNYDRFNSFEYKQDKKPILFKDTDGAWKPVTELRGIDLNICDTIEQHSDGKHYLHVRTEKLVLNGGSNENWVKSSSEKPNHCIFVLNGVNVKLYSKCLSSRFNYDKTIWEKDIQGVTVGDKRLDYFVPNTINTIELWKQNLQQNNETVIILRDKELVYEVNPLDLQSFENETMILFNSGPITPYASWKITSSLPNFVKELSNQIKQLQDQVYVSNAVGLTVALNTLDTKLRLEQLEASKQ